MFKEELAEIRRLKDAARWERVRKLTAEVRIMALAHTLPWTEEEGPPPNMFCRCGSSPCLLRLGREENSLRGTEQQGFFL
jgi:hypothetical protein